MMGPSTEVCFVGALGSNLAMLGNHIRLINLLDNAVTMTLDISRSRFLPTVWLNNGIPYLC